MSLAEGLIDVYTTSEIGDSCRLYWKDAKMINAATGRMEYLSPEWVKQQRWRKAFEEVRSQVSQKRNNWDISKEMEQAYLDRRKREDV